MEKQIPLRLLVYQWVLLQERCMWLSIPCRPCFGSPALEFSSTGKGSPLEVMLRQPQSSGEQRESPVPSHSVSKIMLWIYLQPSNTKWVLRRKTLFLFYWNGKELHPWLCDSRICTPAQSSYSPFSSTHPCLAVLPLSIGFGTMTDLWTKQQFLCTVIPTVFSGAPAPPRLWTFHIPLCRNGHFGVGLELEQKEKAQQNATFIEAFNEFTVQVNYIYHIIERVQ